LRAVSPAVVLVLSISMLALPPPPQKVVRVTRCFGEVVLDHHAHLARRTACRSCHGNGVVGKLALPPRLAHDRCRGCHIVEHRGPVDCRGCHALPDEAAVAHTSPRQDSDDDRTPVDKLRDRVPRGDPVDGVVYAPLETEADTRMSGAR
jgi:hypothetical protein